jgi:hypothetical protein
VGGHLCPWALVVRRHTWGVVLVGGGLLCLWALVFVDGCQRGRSLWWGVVVSVGAHIHGWASSMGGPSLVGVVASGVLAFVGGRCPWGVFIVHLQAVRASCWGSFWLVGVCCVGGHLHSWVGVALRGCSRGCGGCVGGCSCSQVGVVHGGSSSWGLFIFNGQLSSLGVVLHGSSVVDRGGAMVESGCQCGTLR